VGSDEVQGICGIIRMVIENGPMIRERFVDCAQ